MINTKTRKRIVVLQYKGDDTPLVYSTCVELVAVNGKEKIGAGVGAIWNSLCKNNGVFENANCKIYYRTLNHHIKTEWK